MLMARLLFDIFSGEPLLLTLYPQPLDAPLRGSYPCLGGFTISSDFHLSKAICQNEMPVLNHLSRTQPFATQPDNLR